MASSASNQTTSSSSSHATIAIAVAITAVLTSLFIGIGVFLKKKLKQKLKNKKSDSPTSVSYGNPLLDTNSRSDRCKYQVGTENSANGQSLSMQNDSTMESGESKHGSWQGNKHAFDSNLKPNQLTTQNQHVFNGQEAKWQETHLELGSLDHLEPLGLRASSLPANLAKEKGLTNLAPLLLAHEALQKPVSGIPSLTRAAPVAPLHSSHGSEESARFSDLSFDEDMDFSFERLGSGTLDEQLSSIALEQKKGFFSDNLYERPSKLYGSDPSSMANRQKLTEHQLSFNNARLLAETFGPTKAPKGFGSTTTLSHTHPPQKSSTVVNFTPQQAPPLPLPPALVSAAILKQKSAPSALKVQPSVPVKSVAAAFDKKSSEGDVGSPAIPTESILLSVPVKSVAATFANQAYTAEVPSSYSAAEVKPAVPVKVVASNFDNMQAAEKEEFMGLSFPSSAEQHIIPIETYVSEMAKFYSSHDHSNSTSVPSGEMAQAGNVMSLQTSVPMGMRLAGQSWPNLVAAKGSRPPMQNLISSGAEDLYPHPPEDLYPLEAVITLNPQAVSAAFGGDTFAQGVSMENVDVKDVGQNSQAHGYGLIYPVSALVQDDGHLVFSSTGQHSAQVGPALPNRLFPSGGASVPSLPGPSSDSVKRSSLSEASSLMSKTPSPPPPPSPPGSEIITPSQIPPMPQSSHLLNAKAAKTPPPPPPPPPPRLAPLASAEEPSQLTSSAVAGSKIPLAPPPPPLPAVKGPTAPTPPPLPSSAPPAPPPVPKSKAPPPPPLPKGKGPPIPPPLPSSAPPAPPPVPKSKAPPPPPLPKGKGPPIPPPAPVPPKGPPPPPGSQPQAATSSKPPPVPQQASAQNLQKLKPLHWDKVRADPSQSMVWDRVKTGSFELNEDEIAALFGTKPNVNKVVGRAPVPSKKKGILDSKKAHNIAIQLRALNISTQDICDAILEGSGMKAELLDVLVKMTPTQDEQKALLEFSGDREELSPAERFLKSVLEIPNAFQRLQAMLFTSCFKDELAGVQEICNCLEAACVEVRENRLFLKLLEAVLKTGNRLNMGTNRGEAEAFKLDALLKLSDVKAGDGKTTLLQFVTEEIIRSEGLKALSGASGGDPAVENAPASEVQTKDINVKRKGLEVVWQLCTELRSIKGAAEVDADALNQSVLKLSNGLLFIQNRLKTSFQEQAQSSDIFGTKDNFGAIMEAFCLQAEKDVLKLKEDVARVFEKVKKVTAYFHGTSRETQPLRLFVIVKDFVGMLEKVCKDVARSLKMNLRD